MMMMEVGQIVDWWGRSRAGEICRQRRSFSHPLSLSLGVRLSTSSHCVVVLVE